MTTPTKNLLPFPSLQFCDGNGDPLAGGLVYTYQDDGTTVKATFQDESGSTLNTNPIVLDSSGRAVIYGTGRYVWAVYSSANVLQYTKPTADPVAIENISAAMLPVVQATTTAAALALLGGAPLGAATPVGCGPLAWSGADAPAKWLLCYGQAISRSTYSALFGVIGTVFGIGNGSTTFNVPDMRGRTWFGADAMGGTAANRLNAASIGVLAVPGLGTGDQLSQGHLHVVSITDPGHTHALAGSVLGSTTGTPGSTAGLTPGGLQYYDLPSTASGVTGITAVTALSLTGTTQNIPPATVGNFIIYAGV